MSYFKGMKLTRQGEKLQAKINGNLSEVLTFTRAKLGSGNITSENEIRFLTKLKAEWGTAQISNCTINTENKVSIELQFDNSKLKKDEIFRELALYAKGNDGAEVLYAYANAGDNYDYIPLAKDSPHTFIVTIHFAISSSAKVNAVIDLNSYVSLKTFSEKMNKLEENRWRFYSKKIGNKETDTDVDDILEVGKYCSEDALNKFLHLPEELLNGAFLLDVESIRGDDSIYKSQTIKGYKSNKIFKRAKDDSGWSAWEKTADDLSLFEPAIKTKNSGFNLDKTDSYQTDDSNKVATAKGLYKLYKWVTKVLVTITNSIQRAYDRGTEGVNIANSKLTKGDTNQMSAHSSKWSNIVDGNTKPAIERVESNGFNIDGRFKSAEGYWGYGTYRGWQNFNIVGFKKDNNTNIPDTHFALDLQGNAWINDVRMTTEKDLANTLGVTTYNKSLNVSGTKYAGQAYYDNNTKKMYICTVTNTYVSAEVNCYVPFDNASLLAALDKKITLNGEKYDNLEIKCNFGNWKSSTEKINFATPFKNKCVQIVVIDRYNGPKIYSLNEYDRFGFTLYQDKNIEDSFEYFAIGY